MTYRYVAYDIQTTLKKNFDQADILLPQILYWIQVVANNIRARHYEETNTDAFLSTFSSVSVQVDGKGRPYIDLPSQIMDLSNDRGVSYITYNHDSGCCCSGPAFAQVFFQPTKAAAAHRLYGDEYEKPSPQNPYFYRVGEKVDNVSVNRLYFLGLECIKPIDVEIGLMCSLNPSMVCDIDDEVPLPDELISVLITEVLQLGRFVTFMPEERVNEGGDNAKATVNNVPDIQAQDQQQQQ